ncbi:MAG TPA: DUF1800 family protein [Kiritimatiellia bacterium]|nr:DUF1800 family protein [Kiritimatiellia bacterium]
MAVAVMVGAVASTYAWIDRSGSGLSDVWETAYGLGLDPHADDDGDGFTNLQEAIAGTDPHDPASYPSRVVFRPVSPKTVIAQFPTVAGIRYQPQVSSDLFAWFPVGLPVIGDGGWYERVIELETTFTSGGLTRSVWTNLTGSGVNLIKQYVSNNVPPHIADTVAMIDFPPTNPNQDQFGQYIRGWLIPPVGGLYTFWIASDDNSELWLSTNASPAGKSRIAYVSGWTSHRQWTKYPEQQSAPVLLETNRSYYFEVYQRESHGGDNLSVAWTLPGAPLDQRDIIGVPHVSSSGLSIRDLAGDGVVSFRLRIDQVDSDGDGVSDYEEHLLGLNPSLATSKPRQSDYPAALAILDSGNLVTIGATTPRAYEAGVVPGRFTVYRAGSVQPLTIAYTVSGNAVPGADYHPLSGTVVIPPGQRSAVIDVIPIPDGLLEPQETVTVTLQPGDGFALGVPASATVAIDDAMDVLYVASLRPPADVLSSGYGHAVIRRAGNGQHALVRVSFHGLSGDNTASTLLVSGNGLTGPAVLDLPTGQIPDHAWSLAPTNGFSSADLVTQLDAGNLWVRLASAGVPGGELIGRFVLSPGWDAMPELPEPPAAPAAPATDGEAARFLAQATFGPTYAEITNATGASYAGWIDAQLALPPTYHRPYVEHRRAELLARGDSDGWQTPRHEAWWQHAIDAPDQLRQRMAWALSQILVISQFGPLDGEHIGTTLYYDMLLEHAFGNFRDLIEEVTLSPMMGTYLSMMRNRKPDPETGHEPDENFAREIMQLFTIGLMRMHPDGSLMLDAEGMPIPTYTQDDIVGLAHVFTGWSAHYDTNDPPRWNNGTIASPSGWFQWGWDSLRPMSFYGAFHDTSNRVIAGNVLIPAGTNGVERLRLALDALFHHPNTGPFIARQLIQRFVTSNPGPGYVYRVAAAFNDNGQGVRGDLGATIKAVLLDPEARAPAVRASATYGKPIEPVMRISRMLRMFRPSAPFAAQGDHRLFLNYLYSMPEQAPLHSPSVFNFFQPVYAQPGRITREGLLSPEFQIFAETTAIRQANLHYAALNWGIWTPEPLGGTNGNAVLQLNLQPLVDILQTPGLTPAQAQGRLLDFLDDAILFGAMSPALRTDIQNAFASLPGWFDYNLTRQRQRAAMALYLVYNSPEFLTQR